MAKKKGKAVVSKGMKVQELHDLLDRKGFEAHILRAPRADLNRYVVDIAGKAPHEMRTDEEVMAALLRWAAGDKNWGNEPPRKPVNATQSDTHKEETMKKGKGHKTSAKVNGKAKANGNGKAKAVKKERTKGGLRKPDGTKMLNPWSERTAWFRKAISEAKDKKRTDSDIMKAAEKEFGKDNVGHGPWTVAEQRKRMKKAA